MSLKSNPQAHSRFAFRKTVVAVFALAAVPWSGALAQVNQPVSPVKTSPFDEPLALLAKGREIYQKNVRDYSCTMISQERIRGELQPENVKTLKFRNQPFSVAMEWLAPKQFKGQEVVFVYGQNNNMMRVKSHGIKGIVGFVSIDPRDPRALEHSNHTIMEAGIWNLMERCRKDWEKERQFNRTQVQVAEYMFNKSRCKRIEVTSLQKTGERYCFRTVLYLDEQTCLPVRVENYDWPRPGGPPQGEVIEVYSYVNMQFNQNLGDQDFSK
jgi:hypothetical protein